MILSTYLIGVAIALYLIAKALESKEESEGGVVCYTFALLSWVTVFIIVLMKCFRMVRHI